MAASVFHKVEKAYERGLIEAGRLLLEPRDPGDDKAHERAAVMASLKFEEVYGRAIRDLRLKHRPETLQDAVCTLKQKHPEVARFNF